MKLKREQQLIELLTQMEFTDILGFAAIMGTEIQKDESFEDFITNLVMDFDAMPRSKRKQLIKLAKDVVGANQDIKKFQESQPNDSTQNLEN